MTLKMPKIEFEYRDFWEVPRLLVCTVGEVELLLDAEYDETKDAYADEYKVYKMPPELPANATVSWNDPSLPKPVFLGVIPVSAIEFDATRRKELEAAPLLALLARRPADRE